MVSKEGYGKLPYPMTLLNALLTKGKVIFTRRYVRQVLPTYLMQKKNKKERIRELLMLGNLTHEQIAIQANTNVAYVTKTKSNLIKEGRLPRLINTRQATQVLEPRSVPSPVDYAVDQMQAIMVKKIMPPTNHPGSLTEKQVGILYSLLNEGFEPAKIIENTGLPPALVEIEYERFQRLKGRDMVSFQRQLFPFIESKGFQDHRMPKLKIGELNAQELASILKAFSFFQLKFGTNFAVDNPYYPLPEGWRRILCKRCGHPIGGILIDCRSGFAKSLENLLTSSPTYSKHCMCDDQFRGFIQDLNQLPFMQLKESAENLQCAVELSDNSDSFNTS